MATFRAENRVLRDALFQAGFTAVNDRRVAAPKGLNARKGRSLFHKVFVKAARWEEDCILPCFHGFKEHLKGSESERVPGFFCFCEWAGTYAAICKMVCQSKRAHMRAS